MNQAHYHLIVNHLPIIVPIIALLVLLGGFAVKSEIVKRTAYLIFIGGSLAAIAAMSTGEGAEDAVAHMETITDSSIHAHEETAELFAVLSYILGAAAAFGLWSSIRKKSYSVPVGYVIIAYTIVVLYFAQQTGTSGGEVRHTEIRADRVITR